jgi:hypothetical protein
MEREQYRGKAETGTLGIREVEREVGIGEMTPYPPGFVRMTKQRGCGKRGL